MKNECRPPLCDKYGDWGPTEGFGLIECVHCAYASSKSFVESFMGATIGCTSIPGDPIHPGHITTIRHSSLLCSLLLIVVNGDEFLKRKKGAAFIPLKARCQIISSFHTDCNIIVVPFEPSNPEDMTVIEALEILQPHKFFKGGDRKDMTSIPEWYTCEKLGIEIMTGIGDEKHWSSSDFLRKWDERKTNGSKEG